MAVNGMGLRVLIRKAYEYTGGHDYFLPFHFVNKMSFANRFGQVPKCAHFVDQTDLESVWI